MFSLSFRSLLLNFLLSTFLQPFHGSWIFPCFLSTITTLLLLFFTLHLLKLRVWCNCEICQTYVQSAWALQFPNLCDWYTFLLQNSPTRTIHIHVLNNTITANPENVEYMLKTRFDNFPKGKPFSAILADFLGRGIFNVDGDSWRFQRKIASLELNLLHTRLYSFEVVIEEIILRLVPLMEAFALNNEVMDLQDVFRRFSFDNISRFSLGLDPKCLELLSLPLPEFTVAFDLASKLSAERAMTTSPFVWKIKRLLNIGSERKLREAIETVQLVARDFIKLRRKLGVSDQKDLLSRFMTTISDETYLIDIIVSFLLAGRDTVASALTSFFFLVARHPKVEAAILLEAEKVIGDDQPSYDQIGKLNYLHASVYESMRLYPPIQFDSKFCLDDDFLPDGSFVKRGTRVTYHPYAMGRMEEIWGADYLEFKPERWIKDGVFVHVENPFKCPVFQAGTRVCLGKEVALVELKTVAVSVLRRFRIELVQSEQTPRFSPGLTATFRDGLQALVWARVLPSDTGEI